MTSRYFAFLSRWSHILLLSCFLTTFQSPCFSHVKVARAVLTYHAPSSHIVSNSARLSVISKSPPLMFPSYSSEDLREYRPVGRSDTTDEGSSYSFWNMMKGSSSTSALPSMPFGVGDSDTDTVSSRGVRLAKNAYENSKKASSRFCYGICGGWGSGDGLFGVLSSGGPFGLGLRLGIFLVLLVWVLWDCLGQ